MFKKKTFLVLNILMLLISLPVYSQGFGNSNLLKVIGQLVFLIVVFIAMIFLTLYGTKLIAKNAGGMARSKYIQLLDAINVPGGSKIVITKINNKIYILSMDSNGSNLIDVVDEKDFLITEEDSGSNIHNNLIMDKLSKSKINKRMKFFFNNLTIKRIINKEDKNDEKED